MSVLFCGRYPLSGLSLHWRMVCFLQSNETITYKTKLYSFGKHFKTAVVKNKMDQLSIGILPKKKHLLRK